MDATRICRCCQVAKPLTREFFCFRTKGAKLSTDCRACRSEADRQRYRTTPGRAESQRLRSRRTAAADPDHNAKSRAWHAANPERAKLTGRRNAPKYKYGISRGQYDAMLDAQGRRCAICSATEPGGRGTFCLDHNHVTGELRKFLCMRCNRGLGFFRDRPDLLLAAAEYLKHHAPVAVVGA